LGRIAKHLIVRFLFYQDELFVCGQRPYILHPRNVTRKWFPLESAKRATKLAIALHNIAPVIEINQSQFSLFYLL